VKRIVGLAAIFCSFSIFAFAAAPSDIVDLVGTRATGDAPSGAAGAELAIRQRAARSANHSREFVAADGFPTDWNSNHLVSLSVRFLCVHWHK